MTSFSLTRNLVQKLAWPAFEQGSLVKEKLVNLCCTHEQIKLVKENLVVCAVLKPQLWQAVVYTSQPPKPHLESGQKDAEGITGEEFLFLFYFYLNNNWGYQTSNETEYEYVNAQIKLHRFCIKRKLNLASNVS